MFIATGIRASALATFAAPLLFLAGTASAADGHDHEQAAPVTLPAAQEERAQRLEDEFISPCCWHQPVSAHDSPAARQMKADIRRMIADGSTDDAVRAHYVRIHGEKIMTVPPAGGFNSLAWMIPLAAGIFGVFIAGRLLSSWKRDTSDDAPEAGNSPEYSKVDDALRRWDR